MIHFVIYYKATPAYLGASISISSGRSIVPRLITAVGGVLISNCRTHAVPVVGLFGMVMVINEATGTANRDRLLGLVTSDWM